MSANKHSNEESSTAAPSSRVPESPFLDREFFPEVEGEAAEPWASRLQGYQLESPFQFAFEDVPGVLLEPEVHLDEEALYEQELEQTGWGVSASVETESVHTDSLERGVLLDAEPPSYPREGTDDFDHDDGTTLSQELWEGELDRASATYVKWVQRSLNRILGSQLSVDGIVGSRTRSAILNFQRGRGLKVDGIVGRRTEAALMAAGAGRPPTGIVPMAPGPAPSMDASFTPVPVEDPGGGRIRDKRDPLAADVVAVSGVRGRQIQLHRLAADAWRALVGAARAAGIPDPLLLPTSGYRSSKRQAELFRRAVARYGSERAARRWVAPPGGSAHQSGRAIDFYLGGRNSSRNVANLRKKPAYLWLARHAREFGFYPYEREPWHWEYNPPAGIDDRQEAFSTLASGEAGLDVTRERRLLETDEDDESASLAGAEGGFPDETELEDLEASIEGLYDVAEAPYDDEEPPLWDVASLEAETEVQSETWAEVEEDEGLPALADSGFAQAEAVPMSESSVGPASFLPAWIADAVKGGLLTLQAAWAIASGQRDVNTLTNMVFYARNPKLPVGHKIQPHEKDLARQWLHIRDDVIRPLLRRLAAGGPAASPRASPSPAPVRPAPSAAASLPNLGADQTPPADPNAYRRFRLTTYHVADQRDAPTGAVRVPIYDERGRKIAEGSPEFFAKLSLEGTALLTDGRLVNVSGKRVPVSHDEYAAVLAYHERAYAQRNRKRREQGRKPIPTTYSGIVVENDRVVRALAFHVIPESRRGVGYGVRRGIPHVPFRTLAADIGHEKYTRVDPTWKGKGGLVPPGTHVYIKEYDGLSLPDGTKHDGWFIVNDTGGGIFGAHFDVFVGTHALREQVDLPGFAHVWFDGIEKRIPPDYRYGLQA